MWEAKYHAKSSLPKKEGQYSLFIGRWQPLHEGHKQLFNQVIEQGGKVCIAIREGEVNEKNPFTPREVMMNICKEMEQQVNSSKVKVIIIPDIDSVCFGRGVGYDVVEFIPPAEIAEISATKIREELKKKANDSTK
jgi:adenylylsulfate kinase